MNKGNKTPGKSQYDWELIRKTTIRVLRDLWIPASISLAIEIIRNYKDWPGFFTFLGAFFTTTFYAGAYFAYVQRAKKFVIDERNHNKVTGKQDALTNRLENLADELTIRQDVVLKRFEVLRDDLEGLTTGGDGFAYVWLVRTSDTAVFELNVSVNGKFPLHEARLSVSNLTSTQAKLNLARKTGDPFALMASDFSYGPSTMIPNIVYPIRCNLPITEKNKIRLHLNWQAKNGTWYQRIQLEKIGNDWKMATFVKRGEDVIFSKTDDVYPKNASGKPIFEEYELA